MPLSATRDHVVGQQRRQPAEGVGVDLEGLQVAGVDADQPRAERERALGLGLVVHLDQRGQAELAGVVVERLQQRRSGAPRRSAAPGRRRPRAPRAAGRARPRSPCAAPGCRTAARTARRSSRLPPNRRSSVSTLIAAAPPAAYAAARAAGSGMSASSPLLGLRRFTSAITDEPGGAEGGHRVERRRHVEQPAAQLGLGDLRPAAGEVLAHARDDVVEHGHAGTSWRPSVGRKRWTAAKPLTRHQRGRASARRRGRRLPRRLGRVAPHEPTKSPRCRRRRTTRTARSRSGETRRRSGHDARLRQPPAHLPVRFRADPRGPGDHPRLAVQGRSRPAGTSPSAGSSAAPSRCAGTLRLLLLAHPARCTPKAERSLSVEEPLCGTPSVEGPLLRCAVALRSFARGRSRNHGSWRDHLGRRAWRPCLNQRAIASSIACEEPAAAGVSKPPQLARPPSFETAAALRQRSGPAEPGPPFAVRGRASSRGGCGATHERQGQDDQAGAEPRAARGTTWSPSPRQEAQVQRPRGRRRPGRAAPGAGCSTRRRRRGRRSRSLTPRRPPQPGQ